MWEGDEGKTERNQSLRYRGEGDAHQARSRSTQMEGWAGKRRDES